MKKVFYINDKLKSLLSNIIYEIQNYNSTIMKYTENIQNNIDNSNYIKDNKATILRQSFLIDKTMKLFYDFSDINSNNLILNKSICCITISGIYHAVLDRQTIGRKLIND